MTRAKNVLDKVLAASATNNKWAVFNVAVDGVERLEIEVDAVGISAAVKSLCEGNPDRPKARVTSKDGYKVASLLWPKKGLLVEVVPMSAINSYQGNISAARDLGDSSNDKTRHNKLMELSNAASALEEGDLEAFPEVKAALAAVAGLRDLNTALTQAQAKLKASPGKTEEALQAQRDIDKMRQSIDQMLPVVSTTMETLAVLLNASSELNSQFVALSEQAKSLEEKLKEEKSRLATISKAVKLAVSMH